MFFLIVYLSQSIENYDHTPFLGPQNTCIERIEVEITQEISFGFINITTVLLRFVLKSKLSPARSRSLFSLRFYQHYQATIFLYMS